MVSVSTEVSSAAAMRASQSSSCAAVRIVSYSRSGRGVTGELHLAELASPALEIEVFEQLSQAWRVGLDMREVRNTDGQLRDRA